MENDRANPLRALAHPIFGVALGLMVLNDHVLKGAGVFPGWFTGKLSDFAGLIVAPLVLAALIGARGRGRRAFAFGAVTAWFVGVNLFPFLARAHEQAFAAVGIGFRIYPDPSDLIALSVLPLAWALDGRGAPIAGRATPILGRVGMALGALACIATSPVPGWQSRALLLNLTDDTLEVRVRWVESRVDCDAIADRFDDALPRSVFGPGRTFRLEPDDVMALDRQFMDIEHLGTCDAAIIDADGLPETLVFWDGLELTFVEQGQDIEPLIDRSLAIVDDEGDETYRLVGPFDYRRRPVVDVYDPGMCPDYGETVGYGWSTGLTTGAGRSVLRLDAVEPSVDGCLGLTVTTLSSGRAVEDPRLVFLCVPEEDFPFRAGNEILLSATENHLRMTRTLEREDGSPWVVAELAVYRAEETISEGPFTLEPVEVEARCRGVRLDCGGFRLPAAGGIFLSDGLRYVHPGEIVERDAGARRARLRVGRADILWATQESCGAERSELGQRLDALVVYGEERR